jgi:uncharacterized protein YkwD
MRSVASLIAAITCLTLLAAVPAAQARAGSPRLDRAERGLIRAINRQRAAAGLLQVTATRKLHRAANYHSREMLSGNYFAHPSINGASMERRVRRFKRSPYVGETLAMVGGRCNGRMPGTVISMWMNSGSHRAILLSPGFRSVGVGRRGGRLGGSRACIVTADFAA